MFTKYLKNKDLLFMVIISTLLFSLVALVFNNYIKGLVDFYINLYQLKILLIFLIALSSLIGTNKKIKIKINYLVLFLTIILLTIFSKLVAIYFNIDFLIDLTDFILIYLIYLSNIISFEKEYLKNRILGKVKIIIIILLFLGLLWRLPGITSNSFWIDEAISGTIIKNLLSTIRFTTPAGINYPYWLYILPSAIIYATTGNIEFSSRIIPVICGTLSIYFSFLVTDKLFNKYTAIICSIFTTFSTWSIIWSKQARPYTIANIILIIIIYVLILNIEQKFSNRKLIFALLILIILLTLSYTSGILIIVPIVIYIYIHERKYLVNLLSIIYRIYYLFIPLFIFLIFIFLQFFSISDFIKILEIKYNNFNFDYILYEDILKNYFYCLWPFALIGLIAIIYRYIKLKEVMFFVFLLCIIPMLISIILIYKMYDRYVYLWMSFTLYSLSSYGIYIIFYKTKTTSKLLILVLLLILNSNSIILWPENEIKTKNFPQINYKKTFTYLKSVIGSDDAVISVTQGSTPAYVYLDNKYINQNNYCLDFTSEPYELSYKSWSRYDNEYNYYYSNYINERIITNYWDLQNVIKENYRNIWIVYDHNKLYHLNDDVKLLLKNNTKYIPEGSDQTISLYQVRNF